MKSGSLLPQPNKGATRTLTSPAWLCHFAIGGGHVNNAFYLVNEGIGPEVSLVIVQPAGNAEARKNYARTVDSPIDLGQTAEHLGTADQVTLENLHPSGGVPVWGTTAGERGQMETRWSRISSGDIVLFTGNGRAFKVARVTHAFRSASLADEIWERKITANGSRAPWEFMYSFNQPVDIDLPYDTIRRIIEEKPFPTREFAVLDRERSAPIIDYLNENVLAPPALPTLAETKRVVREFDELDVEQTTTRRMEQSFLRQFLLQGSSGTCLLCDRPFSADFLVAAHIKKRSLCTEEEKLDISNVAMLACKFGCDELFERGMVVVADTGKISATKKLTDQTARSYFDQYMDRSIVSWVDLEASHKYFQFHYALHK